MTRDWYLLVFLHVLLYFVRKRMIYCGFSMYWQEIHGFALVLPGFGSGATGGAQVAIIPMRTSKHFPDISIIGILGISYTFIGICHSGLVFIGILACFAIFYSKPYDLLKLLYVLARELWICIGFTRF